MAGWLAIVALFALGLSVWSYLRWRARWRAKRSWSLLPELLGAESRGDGTYAPDLGLDRDVLLSIEPSAHRLVLQPLGQPATWPTEPGGALGSFWYGFESHRRLSRARQSIGVEWQHGRFVVDRPRPAHPAGLEDAALALAWLAEGLVDDWKRLGDLGSTEAIAAALLAEHVVEGVAFSEPQRAALDELLRLHPDTEPARAAFRSSLGDAAKDVADDGLWAAALQHRVAGSDMRGSERLVEPLFDDPDLTVASTAFRVAGERPLRGLAPRLGAIVEAGRSRQARPEERARAVAALGPALALGHRLRVEDIREWSDDEVKGTLDHLIRAGDHGLASELERRADRAPKGPGAAFWHDAAKQLRDRIEQERYYREHFPDDYR